MSEHEQAAGEQIPADRSMRNSHSVMSNGTYVVAIEPSGAICFRRVVPPFMSGTLIRQEDYCLDREVFLGPTGYCVVNLRWATGEEPPSADFYAIVDNLETTLSGWESWPVVRMGPQSVQMKLSSVLDENLASS